MAILPISVIYEHYKLLFGHLDNNKLSGFLHVDTLVINVRLYVILQYVWAGKQQQWIHVVNTLFSWYDILLMVFLKCSQT